MSKPHPLLNGILQNSPKGILKPLKIYVIINCHFM